MNSQSCEIIVQKQVDAYNNKDLEAFVSMYSQDIEIYQFPNNLLLSGKTAFLQRYKLRFEESPNVHAKIVKRICHGNYVIDEEILTGAKDGTVAPVATVIYHISDGLINKLWIIS